MKSIKNASVRIYYTDTRMWYEVLRSANLIMLTNKLANFRANDLTPATA